MFWEWQTNGWNLDSDERLMVIRALIGVTTIHWQFLPFTYLLYDVCHKN